MKIIKKFNLLIFLVIPSLLWANNGLYVSAGSGISSPDKSETSVEIPSFQLAYNFKIKQINATLWNIDAGYHVSLSPAWSLRFGGRLVGYEADSTGYFTDNDPVDPDTNYNTHTKTTALFTNTAVFYQPFKQLPLSMYAGFQVGLASSKASGELGANPVDSDPYINDLRYQNQSKQQLAYGASLGLNYQFIQDLGLQLGMQYYDFGQLNLSHGVVGPKRRFATNLNINSQRLTAVSVALTYLF